MSCRALGFGLEQVLIRQPLNAHPGVARAVGRYIKSERNNPCADLFSQAGFTQTGPETWELHPTRYRPEVPDWFTMEEAGAPESWVSGLRRPHSNSLASMIFRSSVGRIV